MNHIAPIGWTKNLDIIDWAIYIAGPEESRLKLDWPTRKKMSWHSKRSWLSCMRNQPWKLFIGTSRLAIYYWMGTLILRFLTLGWPSFTKRRTATFAPELQELCELPFSLPSFWTYIFLVFFFRKRWILMALISSCFPKRKPE